MRSPIVLLVLACACGKTGSPPIHWEDDIDRGFARAAAEDRPVVMFFGASWDSAAKELEHETFGDPRVRDELDPFVAIRVDCSDSEREPYASTWARFAIKGTPTLIFFAPGGKTELGRKYEYVTPLSMRALVRWSAAQRSTQPVSVITRPIPH